MNLAEIETMRMNVWHVHAKYFYKIFDFHKENAECDDWWHNQSYIWSAAKNNAMTPYTYAQRNMLANGNPNIRREDIHTMMQTAYTFLWLFNKNALCAIENGGTREHSVEKI